MTSATRNLGLLGSAATVAAFGFPLFPTTPANAETTDAEASARSALVERLANHEPLTAADKTLIRQNVKAIMTTTDAQLDAVFAEYAKGNEKPLLGLPARETTTVLSDTPGSQSVRVDDESDLEAALMASCGPPNGPNCGWLGPYFEPCGLRNIGFTISTSAENFFGTRYMSFHQHVEAIDNCDAIWPPNGQNLRIDITNWGGLAGWWFEGYGPLHRGYTKFQGSNTGSYYWATQAYFRNCPARIPCVGTWTPSLWSQRFGTPSGWGWLSGWSVNGGRMAYG
jgi:hypothetical protein